MCTHLINFVVGYAVSLTIQTTKSAKFRLEVHKQLAVPSAYDIPSFTNSYRAVIFNIYRFKVIGEQAALN